MKKIIFIFSLSFILGIPMLSIAKEEMTGAKTWKKAPIQCEAFLKNPLVKDQLQIVFGDDANIKVSYDQKNNYCELNIESSDKNKTYQFSSQSSENYIFDGKTISLFLYDPNYPKCENVIEGDFENNVLLDAGYDFPSVEGRCK